MDFASIKRHFIFEIVGF